MLYLWRYFDLAKDRIVRLGLEVLLVAFEVMLDQIKKIIFTARHVTILRGLFIRHSVLFGLFDLR